MDCGRPGAAATRAGHLGEEPRWALRVRTGDGPARNPAGTCEGPAADAARLTLGAGWTRYPVELVANSFDVVARNRVDLDHVAFFDESGHEEFGTGFHLGGFGDVGSGVALGARLGFDDEQFDVLGRFDDNRVAVVECHRALHAVLDVLPNIASDVAGDFVLFKRLAVHEHVVFALAVKELHRGGFHVSGFERIAAFVSAIERRATDEVLHLAFVQGIALAGLDEHHFGHQVGFAVNLDFQAFAKIAGVVRCHGGLHSIRKRIGLFRAMRRTSLTTDRRIVPPCCDKEIGCEEDFADDHAWLDSMKNAIRSARRLREVLRLPPPSVHEKEAIGNSATDDFDHDFPVFVTREFVSRMRPGDPHDPLLRQVLPVAEEDFVVDGFGNDPVGDLHANVAPGVLHKYHGRALVVTTGACGIHCRYCFRREFPYAAAGSRGQSYEPTLQYLREHEDIEEVILSGGDPLTMTDAAIDSLVERIESIDHVTRLRIHTRMPIVVPSRVTRRLIERLRRSRLSVWVVVHANHASEIDSPTRVALERFVDAGIPTLNQSVLLRGVNDDVGTLERLSRRLLDCRVTPYYLHQLDRVAGAAHFEVSPQLGRELIAGLESRLPGFAVPRYVVELPGQASKTRM